jgi:hypothetical protein
MNQLVVIILGLIAATASAADPQQPNIIVVFSDDHAQHALSCLRLEGQPDAPPRPPRRRRRPVRQLVRHQLDLLAQPGHAADRAVFAQERRAGVQPV